MIATTNKSNEYDLQRLHDPFPAEDIEWRIQSAGKTGRGCWGKCLAYVTARAIQNRLDEVVGPLNWRNEFATGPDGGVLCGISIRDPQTGDWVTKWDGAQNTDFESIKGGLSGAEKRAAVQWGIGRYLYNLDVGWAQIVNEESKKNAKYYQPKKVDKGKEIYPAFYWNPPALPGWALPEGESATVNRNGAPPPEEKTHRMVVGEIQQMLAEIGNGAREKADYVFRFVTGDDFGREAVKDETKPEAAFKTAEALRIQIEAMKKNGEPLGELVAMARDQFEA